MPHLSQWEDCVTLNADWGSAATEEGCAEIASICCPGAMLHTNGFSGTSNDLLHSDGFCSAAAVCQDLPQCCSLGRLLRLGIM